MSYNNNIDNNNNTANDILEHILTTMMKLQADIEIFGKKQNRIENQLCALNENLEDILQNEDINEDEDEELSEDEYIMELENAMELSKKDIKFHKKEAKNNGLSYAEWLYMLHSEANEDNEESEDEESEEEDYEENNEEENKEN